MAARSKLTTAAAGSALVAALGAAAYHQLLRRPMPRTTGTVEVDGILAPVVIRRDRWGMPHVHARSEDDAWFGQGFCHGQDRLWQLDLYRRFSCGRLAEIAGPEGLAADRFLRTLGLRRAALREEAALDGRVASALEAYAAGVNAAASDRPLPAELQLLRTRFEPWRPADTLTITKLLALALSTNWERELLRADLARHLGPELAARLDPGYPVGNPVAMTPGDPWDGDGAAAAERVAELRSALGFASEATGSNNWAVSASRSATAGPLLAGDPAPEPEHARDHLRARPLRRRPVLPRDLVPGPARDRLRAEQRRRLVADERRRRHDGSLRRADLAADAGVPAGLLRVRRRGAPARRGRGRDRGQGTRAGPPRRPLDRPWADRQRGARSRRGRAARAALGGHRGALPD